MVPVVWKNLLSPALLVPKNEGSSCLQISVLSARLHGITSQITILRRNMTLLFSMFMRMYYWILQRSFICKFYLGTRLRHTPEDSELHALYVGTSHHVHINLKVALTPDHYTMKVQEGL
jgi:hypothetical protein